VAQNEIRNPKEAIILPIIVVTRQPYLFAMAETTGPVKNMTKHKRGG
jgi:hypothetical protein